MSRITSEIINIEKNALTEVARTEHRKQTRPSLDEHSTKKEKQRGIPAYYAGRYMNAHRREGKRLSAGARWKRNKKR